MFSVNLTFDNTLTMQFCYFFSAKIATFWAINVQVFKTQLEYFCAQLLHSSTLVDTSECMHIGLYRSWSKLIHFVT